MAWPLIPVEQCLTPVSWSRRQQLPASEIEASGPVPVVDQGQKFIAGYSAATDKVLSLDLPIVVFGDHTRAIKYVDFPFIVGADGVKLLKPDTDRFVPKFFYYAIKSLDIGNLGYSRHFSLLKNMEIPCPSIEEQCRAVAFLDEIEQCVQIQRRLVALSEEIRERAISRFLTNGLRGESLEPTDAGLSPQSWEMRPIEDLGRVITGATPSTRVESYYFPHEAFFVAPADLGDWRDVRTTEKHISLEGLSKVRSVEEGSIACCCIGSIGKVGRIAITPAATNQQINTIEPKKDVCSEFLYYLMYHHASYWSGFQSRGTLPILSKGVFQAIRLPMPTDYQEQVEIAALLDSTETNLERQKQELATWVRTLDLCTKKVLNEEITTSVNHPEVVLEG